LVRATLDEPASGLPLPEGGRVCEWSASGDHRAGRFDVSSDVQQCIEDVHVVATGRPVQRSLAMRSTESGVHIGAGLDNRGDGGGAIREVAGPVRRHVQQRA